MSVSPLRLLFLSLRHAEPKLSLKDVEEAFSSHDISDLVDKLLAISGLTTPEASEPDADPPNQNGPSSLPSSPDSTVNPTVN